MALDTPYSAADRLRRFDSCSLSPFPFTVQYQPPLHFVAAVFLRVFPYGFSQVFPLDIGCSPARGLL